MLSKKNKLPTISTGELLRREIKDKTILGKRVENIISQGKYVSDGIITKIIFKRIKNKDARKGYIFDGFPRNKKQLNSLIKNLNLGEAEVLAILVDVSDKEVKSRLGGRRVCNCGATYHIKFNPPKKKGVCDSCGSKLFIRDDDRPSVITNRLKIYHRETDPILDYWEKNDKLIGINGEQSIKKVQQDIIKRLKIHNI
jgi:adenylate kinase